VKLPPRLRYPTPQLEQALAALLLYAVSSLALFGLPIVSDLSGRYVGWGVDPASHVWFLAWWPHAIASGTNPFLTHVVWAPSGYNLAGSTAMPGPSLVLAPLTALFGPVVSYNVLCLAAPALSSWTAFLLCRRVTTRFGPSLLGGYLFGFSTYELGQLTGHPNLAFVALVPVAVLLVVRRLSGDLPPRRFVLLLAAVLVGQFLISTEVALTLALFGGLALLLAIALSGKGARPSLIRATLQIAAAYLISAVPLAPYLYYAAKSASHSPIYAFYPSLYSTDALNFVIPTPLTFVGRHRFAEVSARFSGNISEQVGYLGVPALTAVVAFAASRWRTASARLLALMFVLVGVASLGPTMRIAGSSGITGPWGAFVHLPLVKYILPARLMMYEALLAGLAMALWLAGAGESGFPRWARWVVAGLAVALLLPNPSLPAWRSRVDTPAFFADGLYRAVLRPGETIVIIPYADRGNSMLWQAQAGFAFGMAQGYVSVVPPPEFSRYPILKTLYDGELIPDAGRNLRAFLHDKGVSAIVVEDGRKGPWADLFGSIDTQPESVGGVTVYRVPRSILGASGAQRPRPPGTP
jgi:hypothetical protein